MRGRAYDVVVLGAGPAGTVAARALASLGYEVALLSSRRRHGTLEGISQRAADALRSAGCTETLGRLGAAVPRSSSWNGVSATAGEEYLLERRTFDEALRHDARLGGVSLIEGRVEGISEHREGCEVAARATEGGALFRLRAELAVDARGRGATRSAKGHRRGPATVALARAWSLPAGSPPESLLASFEDGWAWLAAAGGGRAVLQVDVSSHTVAARSERDVGSLYDAIVGRIPLARTRLERARAGVFLEARNATPVLTAGVVTPRSLRVGDAAFALDPLSGQGIFEAVATALAAAPVANTLLRRPGDRALAEEFYARRIEETFLRLARTGRDLYRAEERWSERSFWRERQRWPDAVPARPPDTPASVDVRPVSADGFIVPRRVVVTPDHPRGVWRLDGVELVPLLEHATELTPAGTRRLVAEHAERSGRPVAEVERALAWLRQRGLA
jgi:flavin-dependent dehydrogenase